MWQRILTVFFLAVVAATGAAALDINDSEAFRYSSGGDVDFRVDTNGALHIYNDATIEPASIGITGGDLGVGTNSPGSMLDVEGSFQVASGTSINELSTDDSFADNSDNALPTEQAIKSYVDSSDNAGTDDQTIAEVLAQGDTANDNQGIGIDTISARDADGLTLKDDTTTTFGINNVNGLFVADGGQVGVGTTAPTAQLDVTGVPRFQGLTNCDTIDTDSNGNLACGTDASGSGGTDDQNLTVNNDFSGTDDQLSIEDGNNVLIDDDYAADDQSLTFTEDGSSPGIPSVDHDVSIDNGNTVQVSDYYEEDTTIPDDQTLTTTADTTGTDDMISIANGNSVEIDDDFEANTDNQNLQGTTRSGDTITIPIESGSSTSFTDNFEANTDNQNLQATTRSGDQVTIPLESGGSTTFTDNYEADTTIADDQGLSTTADVSGTDDRISIDNGNNVVIDDDFEADTSAATECSGDNYLGGDGTCYSDSTGSGGDGYLPDDPASSSVNMNSNAINNAETIGLNNIESVSGGELGRDNSIGYLGNWGGNGNAVLWDAYNVQEGNAIDVTGGTGNEDNPQIAVDESQITDTDANNEIQSLDPAARVGDQVTISLEDGGSTSFTDNYEANTDNQDLENARSQDNSVSGDINMNGNTVNNLGSFQLPVGTDCYNGGC